MRRHTFLLAISSAACLLSATASAQSTARPLPTFRLSTPISAVTANFPSTATATTADPSAAGILSASAPLGDTDAAWSPVAVQDTSGTTEFSSLKVTAEARSSANFREVSGSLDTQRAGLDATIGRNFSGNRAVALHIANESSFYKFGNGSTLVPSVSAPFNDLFRTSAGIQVAIQADEHFSWLAGAEVSISGEDLVGLTDSMIFGGLGGIRYRISEDVAFTFGLAGESRLAAEAWVMPFFGMEWEMSDKTSFKVQGSELRLEHQITEHILASCGARYDVRQYRLNGSNPVANGVFRDEEIRVTVGLDWRFSEEATLGLELGQVMWNEFTVLNAAGGLVGETEADPAPYIGLSLRFGM